MGWRASCHRRHPRASGNPVLLSEPQVLVRRGTPLRAADDGFPTAEPVRRDIRWPSTPRSVASAISRRKVVRFPMRLECRACLRQIADVKRQRLRRSAVRASPPLRYIDATSVVPGRFLLSFRVVMGLRPTHRDESHRLRHPRASGGPRPDELDSRFRGNDVTFQRAERGICAPESALG